MPRKKLIRTHQFPYHVTTRTNNKEWFSMTLDKVWIICLKALKESSEKNHIKLHAFVLMNNHYHLLITTPESNIDTFMKEFNKKISDKLRKQTNHINRMFGGPYKWSIINNKAYLYNVYRYIFQNPIRARISKKCNGYIYSSLHYYKAQEIKNIKIQFTIDLDHDYKHLIIFFNAIVLEKENILIKNGLRKKHFLPRKDSNSKRTLCLSDPII